MRPWIIARNKMHSMLLYARVHVFTMLLKITDYQRTECMQASKHKCKHLWQCVCMPAYFCWFSFCFVLFCITTDNDDTLPTGFYDDNFTKHLQLHTKTRFLITYCCCCCCLFVWVFSSKASLIWVLCVGCQSGMVNVHWNTNILRMSC